MFIINGNFDYIAIDFVFSLKEFSYDFDEFLELLKEENLEKFAPRKRTPGEVFEAVSRSLKRVYTDGGVRYETEVIQANDSASNVLERVIQVTQVDRAGRKVSNGQKVSRLFFDKVANNFYYSTNEMPSFLFEDESLAPVPDFILEDIKKITDKIANESNFISPSQIRGTILRLISSIGIPEEGIQSNWTIPKSAESIAESFKHFADTINDKVGQKVIYYKIRPIADEESINKALSGNAVAFATKEFERLLLKEQERIETAEDPDAIAKEIEKSFSEKAQAVIEIIEQHQHLTQETFDKIAEAKNNFEDTLRVFEIPVAM